MTQKELAAVLGARESQISRWLAGRHNPSRVWQMRIAEVLGDVKAPKVGKMVRLDHMPSCSGMGSGT